MVLRWDPPFTAVSLTPFIDQTFTCVSNTHTSSIKRGAVKLWSKTEAFTVCNSLDDVLHGHARLMGSDIAGHLRHADRLQ
jgi:hypothetical protein